MAGRRNCRQRRLAIVVVEQFVDLALQTADNAVVVADGAARLRELLADRGALQRAYLGDVAKR